MHFFTYNDSVGERFYLKTRRLRQSSSIDRWFLKQNIYLDLFTNKATNISEKKSLCFVYKGGPLTGKLKKKLYNIAFGKKIFLNYHFEFFFQLVASERKTFISIYYASEPKILISLRDMYSAMHLGGLFIQKSAKTSQRAAKAQKQKLSKFVPQGFESDSKHIMGNSWIRKIPASLRRLAPVFQGLTPMCLILHEFGCNARTACTKRLKVKQHI